MRSEARAKRSLDRLAALVSPTARVLREDRERDLGVADVVAGDVVRLQAGDQVVADGQLVESVGLSLDESILTGESQPVAPSVGDAIQSVHKQYRRDVVLYADAQREQRLPRRRG